MIYLLRARWIVDGSLAEAVPGRSTKNAGPGYMCRRAAAGPSGPCMPAFFLLG